MERLKAIIIDDELHAREVIEKLLLNYDVPIYILASCPDLISGVAEIKENTPDVLFLDVQMPNHAGYEIVDFLDKIEFEIIFVTAFERYAINAFEINAIDYLLKPIDRFKLDLALKRLIEKINSKQKVLEYHDILKRLRSDRTNKLLIPELNNRRLVDIEDIIALEGDGSYTKIHFIDRNIITASKNLKYFEKKLKNNSAFFRCHRSWLVHIKHVSYFNRSGGQLIMKSGIITRISRRTYDLFENGLNKSFR